MRMCGAPPVCDDAWGVLRYSVPDHWVEGPLVGGGGGGQGLGGGGGHQGHPARLPHAPGGRDLVVHLPLAV